MATPSNSNPLPTHPVYRWIRPDTPLPSKTVSIYELDTTPRSAYINLVFVYRNSNPAAPFMPTDMLADKLALTLERFPIYYGRLNRVGTSDDQEIRPSGEGVPVYETCLSQSMAECDARWPCRDLPHDFDRPSLYATRGDPLLAVHITRYAGNSGVVVTALLHHTIADLAGTALMLHCWSALIRGETPESHVELRDSIRVTPTPPPTSDTSVADINERPSTMVTMRMSREQLAQLKRDISAALPGADNELPPPASPDQAMVTVRWISTLDAVSELVAPAVLRADHAAHSAAQVISGIIDIRRRWPHLIPPNHFGNGLTYIILFYSPQDLLSMVPGRFATDMRRAFSQADEQLVYNTVRANSSSRARWEELENNASSPAFNAIFTTDWSKAGLELLDLGGGVPECVRGCVGILSPGVVYLRGPDDSLDVLFRVPVDAVKQLRADAELRKYSLWIE